MDTCRRCGKRFPNKVEQNALQKTRTNAPDEYEALVKKVGKKVCVCPPRASNAFTSAEQPRDLQSYDKFDK
jgi:hypothetical protein